MDEIITYLKQLDLSEVEAKLYLTLLRSGPTTVRDLAATIKIKRTTAYFYIDLLTDKGLIIKLVKGSKKLVTANAPESLQSLVQKKLTAAKEVKQNFLEILKEIHTQLPNQTNLENAEISYYKRIQGAKRIYDEALKGPELRLYVNLASLEKLLMPNNIGLDYDIFNKALAKNSQLKIYEILADTPKSVEQFDLEKSAKGKRYNYKYIPSHVKITAPGILMYNNKVAIINGENGQIITVVFHNIDYYTNSVSLFDYIWSTLPEPYL